MITAERASNRRIAIGNKAPPSTQTLSDVLFFNAARERSRVGEGENGYRKLEEERHQKIEEAAYFKAKHRDFTLGHQLDDWLEAEREIDEASRPLLSY